MKTQLFLSRFIILLMFAGIANLAWSQHHNFVLPPYFMDVETSSSVPNVLQSAGGSQNPYVCGNSFYDQNDNLMFWVNGTGVYDGQNNGIGTLLHYNNGTNFYQIGREVSIVPIPGQCLKWYIIYTMT